MSMKKCLQNGLHSVKADEDRSTEKYSTQAGSKPITTWLQDLYHFTSTKAHQAFHWITIALLSKCSVSGGTTPLVLRSRLGLVAGVRQPAGGGLANRHEGRQDERKEGKIAWLRGA